MTRIYIGVGSNIEPRENILEALRLLAHRLRLTRLSTFYRTKALLRPQQKDFVNGVAEGETDLTPRELRSLLREIESRLGRVRSADKYAARTIDLDLLLYGDLRVAEPNLALPDPDIRTRAFLAAPLAELAPDLVLPDARETMEQLAGDIDASGLRALRGYSERLRQEVLREPPTS